MSTLSPSMKGYSQSACCRKSCTILINGRQVCIRDETWKECDVSGHKYVANESVSDLP